LALDGLPDRAQSVTSCQKALASVSRRREAARLALPPLVEDVLGWQLGKGVPGGYGIGGRVVPAGQPACLADPRRLSGLADMGENPLHWRGLGDEGDDAGVGATV